MEWLLVRKDAITVLHLIPTFCSRSASLLLNLREAVPRTLAVVDMDYHIPYTNNVVDDFRTGHWCH
jgi:hypothetical protein